MDNFEQHIKRMKGLRDVYEAGTGQHNILSMLITECEIALRQPPVSGECEHPYHSVLGDGEMQPAKCLKCGKVL